jgi:saccharopine dehydrogenase (NADP+, L-glutamate forming)
MDSAARKKGLVFLNECGLDPGIDHLSAMQMIDGIRNRGGAITSFESFTGGLIDDETDPENPWRYKFTWNPRNVVTAGQTTARYLHFGKQKYIPYQQLFKRVTPIHVPGNGYYEGYANRDSLQYVETYGLGGIRTMIRGTLRHAGFCAAWDILVQLGCCDDTYQMEGVSTMTHSGFVDAFLPPMPGYESVEEKLCLHMGIGIDSAELRMLRWSGLFEQTPVELNEGSPARILEHILNKKWALTDKDKDKIVMWHRFKYMLEGKEKVINASLVAIGTDAVNTAMAKTVGLPLGIATKLIAGGRISARGVIIPTKVEFYGPILLELASLGIRLHEYEDG